jgi:hypothetical protein
VLNVIFNDGDIIGVRKFFASDLHTLYKDGQFATEIKKDDAGNVIDGKLYLYTGNMTPSEKYDSINLTRCMYGAHVNAYAENIYIDNIKFKGFGSGAVKAAMRCPNNTFQNCDIAFSGGMMYTQFQTKKYGLRYGNGIEAWQNSNNIVIKDCYIYHTFDSAVSPQGDGASTGNYDSFKLTGNLFEYNNTDLEYFDDMDKTASVTKLTKAIVEENIFRFTSFGWGTRESDKIRGIQGVMRMDMRFDNKIDIKYTGNVIDTPGMDIFNIRNYDLLTSRDVTKEKDDKGNDVEKFSNQVYTGIYKFGHVYDWEAPNKLTEDAKLLGNNEYYYNFYVRNYPYVITNFAYNEGLTNHATASERDTRADIDAEFRNVMSKVDWATDSKFYWYSTEIPMSNQAS